MRWKVGKVARGEKATPGAHSLKEHPSNALLSSPGSGDAATLGPLFDELINAASKLCNMADPLEVELWASSLIATWRATGPPDQEPSEGFMARELVRHARGRTEPRSVAVLLAVAAAAPPEVAEEASAAADSLVSAGVARPRWADQAGRAEPVDAWLGAEAYGDQELVAFSFRFPSGERHTLGVLIDHNFGVIAKDAFVSSSMEALRERWEGIDGLSSKPLPLEDAASKVVSALTMEGLYFDSPATRDLKEISALLKARLARLGLSEALEVESLDARGRHELVGDFLVAPEAAGINLDASAEIASRLVDFCCDFGDGDPLRWSPTVVELCMSDWFPRRVVLKDASVDAVPEAVRAWVRFAGRKKDLTEEMIERTIQVSHALEAGFFEAMRNRDRFGDVDPLDAAMPDQDDGSPDADKEVEPAWSEKLDAGRLEDRRQGASRISVS